MRILSKKKLKHLEVNRNLVKNLTSLTRTLMPKIDRRKKSMEFHYLNA
jgi:hypothetical protein